MQTSKRRHAEFMQKIAELTAHYHPEWVVEECEAGVVLRQPETRSVAERLKLAELQVLNKKIFL